MGNVNYILNVRSSIIELHRLLTSIVLLPKVVWIKLF